jgi:hypothetical protein
MPGGQCLEGSDKVANFQLRWADPDPATILLQHIDACPSIWRIHHEMHRPIRFEHASQRFEPCIRVHKMMENPGAHNLIKARLQISDPLDGELVDLEVLQVVIPLELLSMAHTRCAEVDAGNMGLRPTQGMLGRLGCPAPGNQDRSRFAIGPGRPKQMIVPAESLWILPELPVFVEAIDRPRIRITIVEVLDLLCHARCR